jgi:hypothetical protein
MKPNSVRGPYLVYSDGGSAPVAGCHLARQLWRRLQTG